MNLTQKSQGRKALIVFLLSSIYSMAVPLVATPIAVMELSKPHPSDQIYERILYFYISSFIAGVIGLIGIYKLGRMNLFWLPLVGTSSSLGCGVISAFFAFVTGVRLIC